MKRITKKDKEVKAAVVRAEKNNVSLDALANVFGKAAVEKAAKEAGLLPHIWNIRHAFGPSLLQPGVKANRRLAGIHVVVAQNVDGEFVYDIHYNNHREAREIAKKITTKVSLGRELNLDAHWMPKDIFLQRALRS